MLTLRRERFFLPCGWERGGSFYLRFKNEFYDTLDNVNLTKFCQAMEELFKYLFGKCDAVNIYRSLDIITFCKVCINLKYCVYETLKHVFNNCGFEFE